MKITTDNKPRKLVALFEIDKQEDFDYIKGDDAYTPRFVKYKGTWYDTHDTQGIIVGDGGLAGWNMKVSTESPLAEWNSIASDSFFSGLLFHFVGEDEVIVGRYMS